MTSNIAERELQAEKVRITREVHRLVFSFGGSPDDPLAGQLGQFVAAVGALQFVSWRTADTSEGCTVEEARVADALLQLEELYTTARPALETAADLLQQLTTTVEADERRRAGEAAEDAARRKLDDEVQRLADEEDAAEHAARRARLEEQARKQLTGAGT
jgi:hypothetical protein